jgi:hypothetical protein
MINENSICSYFLLLKICFIGAVAFGDRGTSKSDHHREWQGFRLTPTDRHRAYVHCKAVLEQAMAEQREQYRFATSQHERHAPTTTSRAIPCDDLQIGFTSGTAGRVPYCMFIASRLKHGQMCFLQIPPFYGGF